MPRRAFITGITGQDGQHLAEHLNAQGYEVFGMVKGQNNPRAETLRDQLPFVQPVPGDLADLPSLMKAMEVAQPDEALQRIHADCHHGNLLWNAAGPFFLDFDDFTLGPPVQDLWLIAGGRDAESVARREAMVDAYETLRPFDRRTLALVEPLRALRILRYAGWVATRYEDPAFTRAFPEFTAEATWAREIAVLGDLLAAVEAP